MSTYHLDALFHPRRVLMLGEARDAATRQLLANLEASLPADRRSLVGAERRGWTCAPEQAPWPDGDLAVLAGASWLNPGTAARLVRCGVRAVLLPGNDAIPADFMAAARRLSLRLLGPRSAGLASSRDALNLTTLDCRILPGKLALLSQSQTVAATALDWARGRGLGFSRVAITGAEADIDLADLLDHAALDPHTRAVVMQLGRIGDGRKFMSAARACARGKPVVVLQTNPACALGPVGTDPVRSAAFQRAGLVECGSLAGLFDALAALECLPPVEDGDVIVAGNGTGVCTLAVEAMLRQGLRPVTLDGPVQQRILPLAPAARFMPGAVDLGDLDPPTLAEALQSLAQAHATAPLLYIRAPLPGASHEALAGAAGACGLGPRLLTVWLGLDTTLAARRVSAAAGGATFTSPDAAARALRYRWEARRTQELLTRTPPASPSCPESRHRVTTRLEHWVQVGRKEVHGAPAAGIIEAYGLPVHARCGGDRPVHVQIRCHDELGTYLGVGRAAASGAGAPACGFPPLDPLLARRLLESAGVAAESPELVDAYSEGLLRLSQLALEQPSLAAAEMEMEVDAAGGPSIVEDSPRLALRGAPLAERRRVALAPYPSNLEHGVFLRGGRHYLVRPVRPSDEPALLRLLTGTTPEAIRLRFFVSMRQFSHAMAARMTQVDYDRELTLVASSAAEPEEIVATATLVRDGDDRGAEFAVLVHQDHAHGGLGRHLMLQLLAYGRSSGVSVIRGDVLSENLPMRRLARELGFTDHPDPEDPSCRKVETALAPAPAGAAEPGLDGAAPAI